MPVVQGHLRRPGHVRASQAFERLGGFPSQPWLEDVLFGRKLANTVSPILLAPPVITDSRKFVQTGIWRSVARASFILLSLKLHLPFSRTFFKDIR